MKIKTLLLTIFIVIFGSIMAFAQETLNIFDMTYLAKLYKDGDVDIAKKCWDETHFVTSIQGIVNRDSPNLYIIITPIPYGDETNGSADKFWLDKMTIKGEWLGNWNQNQIPNLDAFISMYKNKINGLVVYDDKVPATSNVASTVAGVENLACVRYDIAPNSLYTKLTKEHKIPVKKWLLNKDGSSIFTGKGKIPETDLNSTGSPKCDAYMWAKVKYLDNGKCNPHVLGYYIDSYWINHSQGRLTNNTLTNHDYIISKKGFIFDLSMWEDEPATDEPNQPVGADFNTLNAIFKSTYELNHGKFTHLAGFIPWAFKYTSRVGGKHEDVLGEWRTVEIISCYNIYQDADALAVSGMANASIFSKAPMKEKYTQKRPTLDDLRDMGLILPDGSVKKTTYFSMFMGDYDASAWLYQTMPYIWEDPARGEIPLGWSFNPNLSERFAFGMDYVRKTATDNDFFICGDSGAGYINPSLLIEPRPFSNLPSGIEAWEEHCNYWMGKFDLSIIGLVVHGSARQMNDEVLDMLTRMSPDGINSDKPPTHNGVYKGMPYIRYDRDLNRGDEDVMLKDISEILDDIGNEVPDFHIFRSICWTPTQEKFFIENLIKAKNGDAVYLEPYHFFLLMKYFHESEQEPTVSDNNKDLFDYRKGLDVLGYSTIHNDYDIRDMFGGSFSIIEKGKVIFTDDQSYKSQYVEWKIAEPASVAMISLKLMGDQNDSQNRTISHFALKAKLNDSDDWTIIVNKDMPYPYPVINNFEVDKEINAQYFRADFIPNKNAELPNQGSRIMSLQGYSK